VRAGYTPTLAMLAPLLALALAAPLSSAPPFPSLQGGETLGGAASEFAFAAGFSTLSATYAQGWGDGADYGVALEFDWLSTELVLGGLYRQIAWRHGDLALAWRARAGFYADFGSTWALSTNRSDSGARVTPGLALSTRTARGLLAVGADAPFTVTFSRGGGFAIGLLGTLSFETPLWGDLLAGARFGGGALWSRSGAPFANDSPRGLLEVTALLTYRMF
jgi:hypothetical protein